MALVAGSSTRFRGTSQPWRSYDSDLAAQDAITQLQDAACLHIDACRCSCFLDRKTRDGADTESSCSSFRSRE
jgi:hypothetical protein